MRTVVLLRHGKSARPPGVADHDRPLTDRGRLAAAAMGKFLTATHQAPDLAVTSTAVRARDTLLVAHDAGAWSCEVIEVRALYGASPDDVMAIMRSWPPAAARVVVVGHEPTWSETLFRLIAGGRVRFPTAAAASVVFEAATWGGVGPGEGELTWFVPPRLLTDAD